jgi:hypothetical protein
MGGAAVEREWFVVMSGMLAAPAQLVIVRSGDLHLHRGGDKAR